MSLVAGTRLGPYEIQSAIGAGGMGAVDKARDTRLGRDVAVKVLPGDLASDLDRRRRFEQEARAVAALSHANIVALYDVGTHDGAPFLVSELLEGETLTDALRGGALSIGKAVEVGLQIAKGLAAAHARAIVHRDLKPSNVFLTHDGQVKLLDFGIAKLAAAPAARDEDAPTETARDGTEAGTRLGTVGYMAPEQVRGVHCDHRADIFAFGCVLYEMLSGQRAFRGATPADTISAILKEDPRPLTDLRQSVSPALQQIVDRCLEKRADDRFSSAHDLGLALGAAATGSGQARPESEVPGTDARLPAPTTDGPRPETAPASAAAPAGGLLAYVRRPLFVAGLLILVGAVAVAAWFALQASRARWARNVALPEIVRLKNGEKMQAAYALARQAVKHIPDDPQLQQLIKEITVGASITSEPSGARAYYADYADPKAQWELVGTTPLTDTRIPYGFLRWKLEKDGFDDFVGLAEAHELKSGDRAKERPIRVFRLFPRGSALPGMVGVPGGYSFLFGIGTARLEDYWIDRYEVTNADFKRFVDAGGYDTEEYWKQPFVKDGRTLGWKDAVAQFTDKTGRPGPATWSLGTFPAGDGDLPVGGVSWYEAAAFAEFAGKALPTVHHWAYAAGFSAGTTGFTDVVVQSNLSGERPLPVIRNAGLTTYGAYDVAGNVREWVWNAVGEERYHAGGAFDEPLYMFAELDAGSPYDRSPKNGFRCAKFGQPVAPALFAEVQAPEPDYTRSPVGDKEFGTYKSLFYTYDRNKDLRVVQGTSQDNDEWRHETVSFDAGYGGERLPAHLFLPKRAPPPYQTVIFFPDGYATGIKDSNGMDIRWFRFLVQTGRAVLCPVFKGTYERQVPDVDILEFTASWSKEVGRSIDYLKSRGDCDIGKVAFSGFSLGARMGPIVGVVEDRLRTVILLAGGFIDDGLPPQSDPLNFAPRVSMPVLMINGQDDFFAPRVASDRMFSLLGTPDKKHVFIEGGHGLARLEQVQAEVLAWLDAHLGKVQTKR